MFMLSNAPFHENKKIFHAAYTVALRVKTQNDILMTINFSCDLLGYLRDTCILCLPDYHKYIAFILLFRQMLR